MANFNPNLRLLNTPTDISLNQPALLTKKKGNTSEK